MATKKPRTTTEALQKLASAEHKRAHAQVLAHSNAPIAAHGERAEATTLDAAAQAALATPDPLPLVRGGGEAILTRYPDQADDRVADWFVDTLQRPDLVRATASLERLRLAQEVGCVELAQDVGETISRRTALSACWPDSWPRRLYGDEIPGPKRSPAEQPAGVLAGRAPRGHLSPGHDSRALAVDLPGRPPDAREAAHRRQANRRGPACARDGRWAGRAWLAR